MKIAKKEIAKKITGTVAHFSTNKHDDIDGLAILSADETQEIKFPPHTAKYVMEIAEKGKTVTVDLMQKDDNDDKQKHFHLAKVTNTETGKSFEPASVPPPHPPVNETIIEMTIPHPELKQDKKGESVGIVFKDSIIHVGPKETKEIMKDIEKGTPLKLKVQQRKEDAGFVNINHLNVYHIKK